MERFSQLETNQVLHRILVLLSFLAISLTGIFLSLHLLDDTDILWHLKTGEIIFHQGPPRQDIYSFVAEGNEWIDAQWLFQLVIYLVYRFFGFPGMSWFLSFMIVLSWGIIFAQSYDRRSYPLTLLICIISLWSARVRFTLRPEIFTFLFITIYLLIFESQLKKPSRRIYLIPVFQLFWANFEGLWPIGISIIGFYFLEMIINYFYRKTIDKTQLKNMLIVLIASLAVSLITPYHIKGFIFPLTLVQQVVLGSNPLKNIIVEFLPPFQSDYPLFFQIPFVLMILIGGASFLLNLKNFSIARFLFWAIFLFLAIRANRNIALFSIISAIYGSKNLSEFLSSRKISLKNILRIKWTSLALGLCLSIFLIVDIITKLFFAQALLYRRFGIGFDLVKYPVSACEFLKEIGFKGKIYNQIVTASYLIWAGYPDWKVYIDGRLEVYGGQQIIEGTDTETAYEEFLEEDEKYKFELALIHFRVGNGIYLARDLLHDYFKWAPIYKDSQFIVFIRNTPENLKIIRNYQLNPEQTLKELH